MRRATIVGMLGGALAGAAVAAALMRPGPGTRAGEPADAPAGTAAVARERAPALDFCSQQSVQERLRHGWADVRDDAMPLDLVEAGLAEFYREVTHLPQGIASRLAGHQTMCETWLAKLGDAGDILGLLDEMARVNHRERAVGPFPALVGDASRFAAVFERRAPESTTDHAAFHAGDVPFVDGATIRYPPGVFHLPRYLPGGLAVPEDVAIVGAGMDETLFVVMDPRLHQEVVRLRLADCTVRTWGPALDFPIHPASVLLERVRFVGFDEEPGSGAALSLLRSVALLARDCRFESGYGDAPGIAMVLDARRPAVLARFEGCLFDGLRLSPRSIHPQATVVFDACRFRRMPVDVTGAVERRAGIVFADTAVQLRDRGAGPPAPRSLDALFPGWREARGG